MPSRQRMTDRSARQASARTWRAVSRAPYPVWAGGGPSLAGAGLVVSVPPAAPVPAGQERVVPGAPVALVAGWPAAGALVVPDVPARVVSSTRMLRCAAAP